MTLTQQQEKLLATSIAKLRFSASGENTLIDSLQHPIIRRSRKERLLLAEKYTIGDVVCAWKNSGVPIRDSRYGYAISVLLKRLAAAGFTRFDLAELSQETMTLRVLKQKGLDEWRSLPLCFLGTLTPITLSDLSRDYFEGKPVLEVSVQDLLSVRNMDDGCKRTLMDHVWDHHDLSMRNTQRLLYKLGFKYEDGDFMQYRTDRRAAETLAQWHKISPRAARLIVRIARKSGWSLPD